MFYIQTLLIFKYQFFSMKTEVTQKQIGKKIADYRKKKGFSQEDLATLIGISRPVMVQIEAGKRGLEVLELLKISEVLEFSIDSFLSNRYATEEPVSIVQEELLVMKKERNPIPVLSMAKLKNVLLYIFEKTAGKSNVGFNKLTQLVFFADFNYYELYEEHLSGLIYMKHPSGPASTQLESAFIQMIEVGELKRIKTNFNGVVQIKLLPMVKSDLQQLKASEKEVIDRVLDQMGDWSSAKIVEYAKKDVPYLAALDGEKISYELAFYREMPYAVREYIEDEE